MPLPNKLLHTTALAALMGMALVSAPALAQSSDTSPQTQEEDGVSSESQSDQNSQSSDQASPDTDDSASVSQEDRLIATVGDKEIRGSDVAAIIGVLPPQVRSQPPEMLIPMALQQLVLRELILDEARAQNLAEDPDVIALVEGETQAAQDNAMVQVWLDRELAGVVTDETVQQAYDNAVAQSETELAPIEELRPSIEQFLRQQAMQGIQARLREGADIVLFDPSGQPIDQAQQSSEGSASSDASNEGEGETSGKDDDANSSENETSN